jgi:FlaA1/EpsC-like NDP-sugar epimerase
MQYLNPRTLLAFAHDVVASVVVWCVAFWLRFNLEIPKDWLEVMVTTLVWVVPASAVIFWLLGLYRGVWRYASIPDLKRILLAGAAIALVVPTALLMLQKTVPRTVLVLNPVLLVMFMGGSRLAYRAWREQRVAGLLDRQREPVFVVGGGEAAVSLLKDLARSSRWRVRGVFDDNAGHRGRELQGITVLGPVAELPDQAMKLGVELAIIAMPDAAHSTRRHAVEICNSAGIKVMTVPSYDDLVSGRVTVSQLRHVELDDLLGRDPVVLDTAGLNEWLSGRVLMVTGAGGSIGSELCRQIARFNPSRLVFFEANEFALYNMEQEFRSKHASIPLIFAIGDVKDPARVEQVMQSYRPSVIFHAAAYKHVPLMETENAWQAVLNNVAGTHVIAQSAARNGVEKFVLISTDKAVNPTSVMGASKRLAEMVCQALQQLAETSFVMVRFGNVLGSTGSAIPKFREQIAAGGPVTVTHPEIRRYFMSIPEAAQLVLQAGLMGNGGEIFVLDMGEPVRIADLARDLIRLSGFTENEIKIVYSGLRPGEKLFEELLAADENSLPTPHPKLRIAQARQENGAWLARLSQWLVRDGIPSDETVKSELAQWVPEYSNR